MDIHDFIDRIEPEQATTADASPEQDLQLMSITSIAVSLKRIADALEKLTPADPRDNPIYRALSEPLNHYGEGIGECIQGQFARKDFA